MAKLTEKQRRFADAYVETGNAHKSALEAGYSETYARTDSHTMLENTRIRSYIDERLDELKKSSIAQQDEVMQYLTSILRGEHTEQILRGIGEGAQTIDDIEVSAKDRIKAAEMIGKRYGIWTEKQQIEHTGAVSFIDDIGEKDAT